jgi:PAS domain S-box-containing protein
MPSEPIRVLHVDDESDFADMAATFLEREDDKFDIETATSASEGLARLGADDFDCVVSDYDMPGQNGIEFLEAVRQKYPELPFVLFTGKGSEEIASEAISAGVNEYLQKGAGTDQYTVLANRIGNLVEKYHAEREAERTRTRLQAITDNSSDAILMVDTDSIIRFANAAVEDLLGYPPKSLTGESLTEIMPSWYRDEHLQGMSQYLEAGERTLNWNAIEFSAHHRDGHEIPVSVSFSEFKEEGERRFVGIIRDISDRVRMEEELREREQRFRQMAENITEVVWMSDSEKQELFYVNAAYEAIWGHSVESLYDNPTSFLDAVHPEDRDRVEEALDVQTTGDYDEEYRIVRSDEEVRWIRDRAIPVRNDAGEVYRVVGIASDITDRKEREQEYNRVVDVFDHTEQIADVGGWEIHPETRDVFWSDNLFEILEWDGDEEPPLEEAFHIYVEEDRQRVENAVEEALANGEPFDVETGVERSDGEIRWVQVQGRPTVENGEVVTLRGAVQDITDQQRREHSLEQQNKQLEQFASVVSHDLRNPLNVAIGRLELAQEECESEHLDIVGDALERSQALIDDLLTLAREGNRVSDIETVDLRTVTENCWDNVATGKATTLTETDRAISADRSQLQQLLENLYRNAIEHASDDVTVTVGDLPNGFYIEDDGPGIPDDERDDVFDAGYSTAEEGTGFGLSIAQQVAQAHNWEIRVTDGSEGGARFEITGVEFADE